PAIMIDRRRRTLLPRCSSGIGFLSYGMNQRILLGSHMSVAGGLHTAFERGTRCGCTTMQIFVKNASTWTGKPLTPDAVASYKAAEAKATIAPVIAHAAYLINLCARADDVLLRSREGLADELLRCSMLGVDGLVVHPGAHLGAGEADGLARIAESLNMIHEQLPGVASRTLLETTAGQGTTLGYRFEQLRRIMDLVDDRTRVAVCLDTCHLFAAGYPIHTEDGWERTMRELEGTVGLENVAAVHVNDSKRELGSRIDRHDHIGNGRLGETAFRMVMNDPRLRDVPKILETEKSEDMHEDIENMARLRSLVE
ncbi:MAG: apurinic endonuclease Apn1, partial [Bacteroidetes bacterium]|nr:apurinic endonuclease Apn1 [Bacteroidota bacterium]